MRFESFKQLLEYRAENNPDSIAFIYEKDGKQTCTYSQFLNVVRAKADELKESGKTCMGVLCDGSFDCVATIFGANLAGLQIVLLDENAPVAVLQRLIPYTDIDVLWGDDEICDELSPCLAKGVEKGEGNILFFTSGTTETAKAVQLTDFSLCQSAYNGGAKLPLSENDTLMCMLPLGHVFGFVCGLLWGMSCASSVALGRGARHYADDLDYFRPTAVSLVPMLLGFLLKHKLINKELKLILVGAGDCPAALLGAVGAMGIRLSFGYGLTETSSGVAISVQGDPYAMEICPDDTITIAQDGEILIQAPTCMMKGYYKRQSDTDAVLRDGVLYTGDLGYFDENGKLHISGRKKDILVLQDGTKIFLPEYESAVSQALGNPEIAIALQNGRPVLVFCGAGDEKEMFEKLRSVMSQRPRGHQLSKIIFVNEPLPRTATGKIKRWELQQRVEGK